MLRIHTVSDPGPGATPWLFAFLEILS